LRLTHSKGFSLVELLVALVFTLFLMMGMAAVFRSSLTTFYTSGENISSTRRNRLAIELLGEDINMAGMYLTDMSMPPFTVPKMPPFHIRPNMPIEDKGDDDPNLGATDELYFYIDEPLPFEGTLDQAGSTQQSAAEMVLSGAAINTSNEYKVKFLSRDYAAQVEKLVAGYKTEDGVDVPPQRVVAIFKDFWEAMEVGSPKASGQNLTFSASALANSGITGSGGSQLPSRVSHLPNAGVVFVKPAQMVMYTIKMLNLDPNKPDGLVPCLVRYQCTYPYSGTFSRDPDSMQLITENVSGFKVYLSVNGGATWAGLNYGGEGFETGWDGTGGIRSQIDEQLKTAGRPGFQNTIGNEHWFRTTPTLVRVDVTTRTATKRADSYSGGPDEHPVPVYKQLTQTLIFVPRHFGLPMG
jgi:hypothetical protein